MTADIPPVWNNTSGLLINDPHESQKSTTNCSMSPAYIYKSLWSPRSRLNLVHCVIQMGSAGTRLCSSLYVWPNLDLASWRTSPNPALKSNFLTKGFLSNNCIGIWESYWLQPPGSHMLEQVMAMLNQPITRPSRWSKDGKHAPVRVVGKEYSERLLPLY